MLQEAEPLLLLLLGYVCGTHLLHSVALQMVEPFVIG
jgi:hypothetical protein